MTHIALQWRPKGAGPGSRSSVHGQPRTARSGLTLRRSKACPGFGLLGADQLLAVLERPRTCANAVKAIGLSSNRRRLHQGLDAKNLPRVTKAPPDALTQLRDRERFERAVDALEDDLDLFDIVLLTYP